MQLLHYTEIFITLRVSSFEITLRGDFYYITRHDHLLHYASIFITLRGVITLCVDFYYITRQVLHYAVFIT